MASGEFAAVGPVWWSVGIVAALEVGLVAAVVAWESRRRRWSRTWSRDWSIDRARTTRTSDGQAALPIGSAAVTRARVVVLVSGAGTNLQALIDASEDPQYPADVVAVGSDRTDIEGLVRAEACRDPNLCGAAAPTLSSASQWDAALADHVAEFCT